MKFNINDDIKVKLTDYGKEVYYHQNDRFGKQGKEQCDKYLPKVEDIEDEDGYIKFQLWRFMWIFGDHIGCGIPLVIEKNEMIFNLEDFYE